MDIVKLAAHMNRRETGLATIVFGTLFFVAGSTLLMDKAMAVAGNALVIIGVVVLMDRNVSSLFSLKKVRGTLLFSLGIVFLFKRYVVVGFLIEMCGVYILVKDSIPSLKLVLRGVVRRSFRLIR